MNINHVIFCKYLFFYWFSIRWQWSNFAIGLGVDFAENCAFARIGWLNLDISGNRPYWAREKE